MATSSTASSAASCLGPGLLASSSSSPLSCWHPLLAFAVGAYSPSHHAGILSAAWCAGWWIRRSRKPAATPMRRRCISRFAVRSGLIAAGGIVACSASRSKLHHDLQRANPSTSAHRHPSSRSRPSPPGCSLYYFAASRCRSNLGAPWSTDKLKPGFEIGPGFFVFHPRLASDVHGELHATS